MTLEFLKKKRFETFGVEKPATEAKLQNVVCHAENADRTFKHIWFLPTQSPNKKTKELEFLPTLIKKKFVYLTKFRQVLFKSMAIGRKIRQLREEAGLKQRELASQLKIGEGYLSKVESESKPLKREHLKTLSKIFNTSYSELEALWIATKVYDLIKDEEEGLNALKVAEEQIGYQRKKINMNLVQDKLDVKSKKRANLFNWRGQFTPEFVEYIISSSNLESNAFIADPFAGSGTVLIESAVKGFSSVGYEINPAAYQMACFYKYSNLNISERNELLYTIESKLSKVLSNLNGQKVYVDLPNYRASYKGLIDVSKTLQSISDNGTLPFLMNMLFLSEKNKKMTVYESLRYSFNYLKKSLLSLPYCDVDINIHNSDARNISTQYPEKTDLILTSPPYINVFNYHQNHRAVTESFGYDILGVAHSEFGSNRKNRGNRLLTVVQYCLDMESSIKSFWHTLKDNGKLVMVLGRESNVRKTPFYNGEIVKDLITKMGGFGLVGKEERSFGNKFGQMIFEDILIFEKVKNSSPIPKNASSIAEKHLKRAELIAPKEVLLDFKDVFMKLNNVKPSPIFK